MDQFESLRTVMPGVLETPTLLERTCVQPPYFALQTPSHVAGKLRAHARAGFSRGRETGPMRGAEVGRHGAIAGLTAASLQQPFAKRHFYLAKQAVFHQEANPAPYGTPVSFEAAVSDIDKRHATSVVTAHCGGELYAELDISYTVLSEGTFARLFAARRKDTPAVQPVWSLQDGTTRVYGQRAERHAPISVANCQGHFPNYPALPLAVVINELNELGGVLIGGAYRGVEARVVADDFCWAGEDVTMRMRTLGRVRQIFNFQAEVEQNGKIAVRALISLAAS